MGDGPGDYQLYFWDGQDAVPGTDAPTALEHLQTLCTIPLPTSDAKAEGIMLIKETAEQYAFVVVYDGVDHGGPTVFSCQRPAS
jgi:hypothetical protein